MKSVKKSGTIITSNAQADNRITFRKKADS